MSVPIRGFDHVVVMCRDIERSLAFYRDLLGGVAPYEKAFRDGRIRVVPVVLGGAVVNLQRLDEPAYIVATRLEAGALGRAKPEAAADIARRIATLLPA